MNAIDLIERDHALVKRLFRQIETATGEERGDLFQQIHQELTVHTKVEEKLLYPELEEIRSDRAEDLYEEAHDEHDEAKMHLRQMLLLDPDGERFDRHLGKLIRGVEEHIEMEERELLPYLEEHLPSGHLESLGEEMEERKMALMRRVGRTSRFATSLVRSRASHYGDGRRGW